MAKSDALNHFYYLSKWAIQRVFEQNEIDDGLSLGELQKSLERAWKDLHKDGIIVLCKDGKETEM